MRKHFPLDPITGIENAALLPWTDGIPNTGTEGSYPGQALVTDMEAELLNAVAAGGLADSGSDLTQLAQAMSIGLFLGVLGGTANALTASLPGSVPIPQLVAGMRFHAIVGLSANTGPVTLAIGGFNAAAGVQQVLLSDGASALGAGDLQKGRLVTFEWDGANFRIVGLVKSDILAIAKILTAAQTYYVSPTGNDANNGLTAGTAFKTIQAALYAASLYNLNGFNVTIQIADGTYGPITLPSISGAGSCNLVGNVNSPSNVVIAGVNQSAISAFGTGIYILDGIKMTASGSTNTGDPLANLYVASNSAAVFLNRVNFGAAVGGWIISAGGKVTFSANYLSTISGSVTNGHGFTAYGGGSIGSQAPTAPSLTIASGISIAGGNGAFVRVYDLGIANLIFSAINGYANLTAQKYLQSSGGVIDTNGGGASYYPGNTAGSAATGFYQ